MRLKVSKELWTILLADLVNLCKLAIIEQNLVATTIDAFDVHTKTHDDLEVLVLRLIISHTYLNCLV